MLQIKKILFPTDYSACAEHAFSQAAYLAERYDADLHVLHVTEPSLEQLTFDITEADIAADLHLPFSEPLPSANEAREERGMLNVEIPPLEGSVARAILAYADAQDIDMIVMGTHGRGGALWLLLGSVAGKVVRLATCPVFTVRQDTEATSNGRIRRILVPTDFSEHARLAVAYATDLAVTYDAHLDLLHGIEQVALPAIYGIEPPLVQIPDIEKQARKALEQVAVEARRAGVSVETHVHVGHPSHDIIDFAEDQGTDLIVIATHGLTGLKRFFLGSVAEKVVQSAPCPVFTVKGFGKRLLPQAAAVAPSEQQVLVS
jgi:nucleotide-binding universal stress UspA family protein